MTSDTEMRQRVPEPLWPMLEVKRDGWETTLGTDNDGNVWTVMLQYRALNEYTISVAFVGAYGDKPFMVGHHGLDYGYYDSLEEALEVIEQLFPKVETEFHWNSIANFRPLGRRKTFIKHHGVGPKTITRLVKTFSTLEQLRGATPDTIMGVAGIGRKTAQFIADCFRPDRREDK